MEKARDPVRREYLVSSWTRPLAVTIVLLTALSIIPMVHVSASVPTWSSATQIDGNSSMDILPSGVLLSNGTLWLAWQTNRYRGDSQYDISYRTLTNGVWSSVLAFTGTGYNNAPAMAQMSNGSIAMFWAYKASGPGSYLINYKFYNRLTGWSKQFIATSTTLNDTNPAVTVAKDGSLWLAWTRSNNTCTGSCTDLWRQVYYKTLKNNVWSAETKMTTDTNQNMLSGIVAGRDNVVRIVWSKGLGSQQNYQIYYKAYNLTSGVWGSETKIVSSSNSDEHPSIMQDRNGTYWVFWGRKVNINSNTFQYNLWGQYSYNGSTWLGAKQLTSAPSSVDSLNPFAIQNSDKAIWLFYTTDPNSNDDIYALISSQIAPIHDVTITSITSSVLIQYPGGRASVGMSPIVTLTVTVLNNGDTSDVVTGSLTISNTTSYNLGTKQNLPVPGGTTTLVFSWNTTGVKPGWYSTSATVSLANGLETTQNQYDNSLAGKKAVHVLYDSDVNQDGRVDIVDAGIFFLDFGSTPGTPNWNPLCDINNNGIIDIVDVGVVVLQYGSTA